MINVKTSFEFVQIAETDLKASKLLYDNMLFPQALFFLQQTIEKITKGFISLFNLLENDPNLLKKEIGHFPIKLFYILLKESKDRKKLVNINKTNEMLKNSISLSKENIDIEKLLQLLEKESKIFHIFLENEINIISNFVENSESILNLFVDKNYLNSIINEKIDKLSVYNNETFYKFINELQILLEKFVKSLVKLIYPLVFLIIAVPGNCSVDTRYPVDKINPVEKYKVDNPLIKNYLTIFKICNFNISEMKNLTDLYLKLINLFENSKMEEIIKTIQQKKEC